MLTKDSINLLVHGFLHDACSHLGIDDSQINISYMPMPVPMMLVMPWMVFSRLCAVPFLIYVEESSLAMA